MYFISAVVSPLRSLCSNIQISQIYKSDKIPKIYITNPDFFWIKFDLKNCSEFPEFVKIYLFSKLLIFSSYAILRTSRI
jgi:hypothetical protein